jgi:putative toxin-antitoxin system antitoxin component (TIGR02293 family)
MTANELIEEIAKLSPEERAKVCRFVRIHTMTRLLFTDAGGVWEWMNLPAPGLDGRRPIELLGTEAGAEELEALIEGIAHGNVI